jgi:hypothetical protein
MRSLASIATEIQRLHYGLRLRPVLDTAVAAGRLLIAAKARLKHGEWLPWVRQSLPSMSVRTVNVYMQVASSPHLNEQSTANLTIDAFLDLIRRPFIKVTHPSAPTQHHAQHQVHHADARKYPWPRSAQVIATDPPWDDDGAYRWLASFAARKLVTGGLLLLQCGTGELADRLREFSGLRSGRASRSLTYWWTLCMAYVATSRQPTNLPFYATWRPVLCFYKDRKPTECRGTTDTYTVGGHSKTFHDWEQPLGPWQHWLERLTPPGCTVLDPFCGSGTIGVAAKATGRSYIGTDTSNRPSRK